MVTHGDNASLWQDEVEVRAIQESLDILVPCFLDGKMYANLLGYPSKEKLTFRFKVTEPYRKENIAGYGILEGPIQFRQTKGYLPRIIVIYIGVPYEVKIKDESGVDIILGCKDMKIVL